MDQDRAKAAEAALKNVETLKKSLAKSDSVKAKTVPTTPAGPTKIQASGLPEPVAGTGFVQYIMYFIGGVLVLGVVLMIVDRWFFPVFKRSPGAPGYISLPGNDMSDNLWTELKAITDITIGAEPQPTDSSTPPPTPIPLYSSVLASQSTYTITLDVMVNDEKPQNLGADAATNNISRTFFFLGTALDNNNRKVTFTMDNTMNRVHVNVFNANKLIQSCIIDNVPIHTPFRIGFVKTPFAMEAYLNGFLVQTIQLQGEQIDPIMGDKIYAPQNIKYTPPTTTTTSTIPTTVAGTSGTTAPTLPATGSSSDSILAVAIAMLMIGSVIIARRRINS
jgi:LPXTG-motif cell wall-anchored protein